MVFIAVFMPKLTVRSVYFVYSCIPVTGISILSLITYDGLATVVSKCLLTNVQYVRHVLMP